MEPSRNVEFFRLFLQISFLFHCARSALFCVCYFTWNLHNRNTEKHTQALWDLTGSITISFIHLQLSGRTFSRAKREKTCCTQSLATLLFFGSRRTNSKAQQVELSGSRESRERLFPLRWKLIEFLLCFWAQSSGKWGKSVRSTWAVFFWKVESVQCVSALASSNTIGLMAEALETY